MKGKYDYIKLCQEKHYFHSGDNRQYEICIELAGDIFMLRSCFVDFEECREQILKLAAMTYICSVGNCEYDSVVDDLMNLFR